MLNRNDSNFSPKWFDTTFFPTKIGTSWNRKKTFFPTQVDMLAVIANSSRPLLQSAMRNLQEFGNLDAEKRAQADDPNQERSQGHPFLRFHKKYQFFKPITWWRYVKLLDCAINKPKFSVEYFENILTLAISESPVSIFTVIHSTHGGQKWPPVMIVQIMHFWKEMKRAELE